MEKRENSQNAQTRIAVLVLVFVVLAAAYLLFVDRPVRNGIREAEKERAELESKLALLEMQTNNISGVSEEMSSLRAGGQLSWMPSYNSEDAEIDEILELVSKRAPDFSLSLDEVKRSENQIRRGFTLTFTVKKLSVAEKILHGLTHGEIRCLIANTELTWARGEDDAPTGEIEVTIHGTFYETMVGGEPDAGLPEGSRGQAVDKALIGLPPGISSGLDAAVGFVSGEPTIPDIGEITG